MLYLKQTWLSLKFLWQMFSDSLSLSLIASDADHLHINESPTELNWKLLLVTAWHGRFWQMIKIKKAKLKSKPQS